MECTPISFAVNPNKDSPIFVTVRRKNFITAELVIFNTLPLHDIELIVVSLDADLHDRAILSINLADAITGQSVGSPVRRQVTDSNFSEFFWSSNVMLTLVALYLRGESVGICLEFMKKRKFLIHRSFVFLWYWSGTERNSQDLIHQKIAIVQSNAIVSSKSSCAESLSRRITLIGMAFWCFSGGSSFL